MVPLQRDGGDMMEMSPLGAEGTRPGQGHMSSDKEDAIVT